MSTLNQLLRSIIEHLDEDTPRLMYADALDERGDLGDASRAAFIRLQIEMFRTPSKGHGKGVYWRSSCMARAGRLCELMLREAPLKWHLLSPVQDWERGFLRDVQCSWNQFLLYRSLFYWHPAESVQCPGCPACKKGWIYTGKDGMKWIKCRAPVPCPDTAHPVRTVRLTDRVNVRAVGLVGNVGKRDHYTHPDWPGLVFDTTKTL
jgi:uncharacterized protein (TIGR02996 family)